MLKEIYSNSKTMEAKLFGKKYRVLESAGNT